MKTLEGYVGAFLAENKVKRQELADKTGCSLVTFNRRIGGEVDMPISFAYRLADSIGISVDKVCELVLGGSDD